MKQSKTLIALLLAGSAFMGSCIDTNKDIKYNKYTKADTEAFEFLKTTYEQALFQEYAAKNYNLGPESQKITQAYQALAKEIEDLGTKNNVLMPVFSADHFAEKVGAIVPMVALTKADTTSSAVVAAVENPNEVGKETHVEKVIHSQEEVVHQLEIASKNTNVSIRHFGKEKLAEFEELLVKSKASIK